MTQDTAKKKSKNEKATAEQADDPEALRRDIADKRRDLGDTVEELAQKADVKAQVSQRGPQIAAGAIAILVLLLLLRRRRS